MVQGNRQRTARARKLRNNPPEPERVLWQRIRAEQLDTKFRRQHSVGPYVLDFCAPGAKLVIEIDGDSHYETLQIRARDAERDVYLATGGFQVLRFTNREVMENVDGVCEVIQAHLSPPSPPSPRVRGEGGDQKVVLGLDPGLARLGYGVLACDGHTDRCVAFGCIETAKGELGPRLIELRTQLAQLIALYQPDRIVIEKLFFSKNVKTAITVAQARGVIVLTCAESHVEMVEVSPQDVKQAVCGYGAADKRQVQRMVQTLLKLDVIPQPDDAADALAVALAGARKHLTMS